MTIDDLIKKMEQKYFSKEKKITYDFVSLDQMHTSKSDPFGKNAVGLLKALEKKQGKYDFKLNYRNYLDLVFKALNGDLNSKKKIVEILNE